MATVRRYEGLDALSAAAAAELGAIAQAAIAARGTCAIALSGGSTPKRMFQLLARQGRAALPWDRIELWWGDERTVPPDHPDSNYRMTRENLIDPLGIDAAHVHRIRGEDDPAAAAAAYEQELLGALGDPPRFDLILLGMGPDGHTASLFPGSPALDETRAGVVANPVDSPLTKGATTRITLTAEALSWGRHIRFLAAGADKADTLVAVLEGPRDPRRLPSQLIAARGGELAWLVDDAAAAKLGGHA
ncbi:MAG: 6-phosphogluconolactonase [Deltaproteobacteria bacterium]|nr:6-phosphogluconolactonase [Deltaproteobacteria bacterium]